MRIARAARSERGSMTVLFAVLVPMLLLPMGAIVVDIGFWYRNAKHAQTTADAAALAAASQIPSDAAATTAGGQYVTVNMPDVTTSLADATTAGCPDVPDLSYCVEYPYKPDSGPFMGAPQIDEVEVVVRHPAPTFFGRIFGMFGVSSVRRAVAEKFEIPGNLAIFSYQHPLCGSGQGLEFNGDNMQINGLIHSNGAFQINGKDFWAADGTIQKNNCTADVDDPPTSQFGDDPTATLPRDLFDPTHQPWPVWHTPAEFGWLDDCDYWGQKITINPSELKIENPNSTQSLAPSPDPLLSGYKRIPTGTYCATETFEISGEKLEGTFTAVAREIKVSGKQHVFTHYANRTLFFAVPNWNFDEGDDGTEAAAWTDVNCQNDKELVLNAHEYEWSGTIFSPCTRVLINGDNLSTFEGTIVGYQVKVNGAEFNMLGKSEVAAVVELNLVE